MLSKSEQIERIARTILKFRAKHNLYILPSHDVKKWAELVIKEGGCPRVPSRKLYEELEDEVG